MSSPRTLPPRLADRGSSIGNGRRVAPDGALARHCAVRSRAGRRGDDWGGDERRRESRFGNRRELNPERPREPRYPMSNAHPSGVVRSSEPFGSCLLPKSSPVRQYNSGGCHLAPAHRLARSRPRTPDRGEAFSDRGSAERELAGNEHVSRQVSLWCEREPMGQSGELLESFRSIDYAADSWRWSGDLKRVLTVAF